MIPTFATPDPPAVSPYLDEVEAHLHAFGRRIGLGKTEDGIRRLQAGYGEFVAWTYPAASYEDLCLCAEWLFITFLLDDLHTLSRYDSPGAWKPVHRRLRQLIVSGQDTDSDTAFTRAIAEVAYRTRQRVSADFYRRFTRHLDLFFTGFERESQDRSHGDIPAVDDFTQTRRLSVGMEFGFDLVELSHRIEISDLVYSLPAYQALVASASDIVAWQNDMHSVHLDIQRGDVHNLVLVLRADRNIDLDRARTLTADKIAQRIADFGAGETALRDVLRQLDIGADECDEILGAVAGMRQWTNGCLRWYRSTTRYTMPDPAEHPDSQHSYLQELIWSPNKPGSFRPRDPNSAAVGGTQ
ncbi:terpene synthase family protein [Nocardia thraciensis]